MVGLILKSKLSLLIPVLVLLAVGCRNLTVNDQPPQGNLLPQSQMESDSVAVRVAVAELDDHQKEEFESLIATTDQKLPLEIRRRLDDNGLRVSIVTNYNTAQMQRLLAPRNLKPEWLSATDLELRNAGKLEPLRRITSQRHVEKKRGESFTVEVSSVRPRSTWTVHSGTGSVSDQADLAQCQMRITSWPRPDGSVKMELIPEIHYGESLSRIGVDGQNFAVEKRRDFKQLRSLGFTIEIQPGETILVAPTGKLERIGELFFNAANEIADPEQPQAESGSVAEDDIDTDEFFPMLKKDTPADTADVSVSGSDSRLASDSSQRPRPWQRFLLIRVTEVTPSAIR